jgi:hypothetical protein
MTTVDIHVGRRTALETEERPTLALALAERGVDVTFSRALEAYDLEAGRASVLRARFRRLGVGKYEVSTAPDSIPLEDIDAIRNIALPLGGGLPELNPPDVRNLTEDKFTANRLLAGLGLAKSFALLDRRAAIAEVLEAVPGPQVIVKPRGGARSRNIWVGPKERLEALHAAGKVNLAGDWIVEELLDLTTPLQVRSADPGEQHKIDDANRQWFPKEIRVITFGRGPGGGLITSAVVRLGTTGDRYLGHRAEDVWVTLDLASIPPALFAGTDRIAHAIEEASSTTEHFLAVDWALARRPTEPDPAWIPIELNSGPELMWEQDDLAAARDQIGKLADQLCRVAGGPRAEIASHHGGET